MIIKRKDLLHDIAGTAYIIADSWEGKESPHALHQIFDICEAGNIDRVDSLLKLAAAEAAYELSPIVTLSTWRHNFRLAFPRPAAPAFCRCYAPESASKAMETALFEVTREFMVASVIHSWLAMLLPSVAAHWEKRKNSKLESLRSTVARAVSARNATLRRRLSPF